MNDEEPTKAMKIQDEADFTPAYDFNKHLSTLSLISIGGVLGLLQNAEVGISARAASLSIASLGLAALAALLMNAMIVGIGLSADSSRLSAKFVQRAQGIAVALLLFGAGIFTGAFGKSIAY